MPGEREIHEIHHKHEGKNDWTMGDFWSKLTRFLFLGRQNQINAIDISNMSIRRTNAQSKKGLRSGGNHASKSYQLFLREYVGTPNLACENKLVTRPISSVAAGAKRRKSNSGKLR